MCDRIMLEIDDNWMKVNKTPNVGSGATSMPSVRSTFSYSCDKGATEAVGATGAMPLSLCDRFMQEIDDNWTSVQVTPNVGSKTLAEIERTTFQTPIRRGMSQGEGAGCVKKDLAAIDV